MARGFQAPRFGTDGLRGEAGVPPMDPETLRRVGSALGLVLQETGGEKKRVLFGNDGRDSAPWILDAVAQGLSAADVSVWDVGLCTTPALAYLTRTEPFEAGIMISASHNPSNDNGIKIFGADGRKLSDGAERQIEELTTTVRPAENREPRVRDGSRLLLRYEEYLGSAFPDTDLTGLKVVVDAANGGGSEIAPRMLRAFGAEVLAIACEPDGFNINDGVGALHPEVLSKTVLAHEADFGISLDGDGDRGIFVDEGGRIRDGDDVLAAFGLRLKSADSLPGDTVVATVMSNLGLHRALEAAGVTVHVTPVGDRSVMQAMMEGGYALGGEQSGHILFAGPAALNGDGLYTALRLLSLPELRERGASSVFAHFQRFPQKLVNVRVTSKPDLDGIPVIHREVEAVKARLGNEGRVLLRYSGTEPLCRVMVEASSAELVEETCKQLVEVVRAELGEK